MTSLQVGAVLACVQIICRGVASLPLHVFERQIRDGRMAKRVAHDHPMYDLLRGSPNEEMTSFTFRATLQCHMLLWGNGYAELQRDNGAQIIAMWPRNPARTRPVRLTSAAVIEGTRYPAGTLVFHTSEIMGDEISAVDDSQNRMAPERIILAEDMVHMPGLSLDGRLGQSTVYLARQIFGLALASEKYGAKFFGNGAVPAGVLEVPNALEPKAFETLRRSWAEAHGGENAQKTAVLEQGVKYTPIGIDPQKGQFLETRHYQRAEVAAVFNVPLHMIGEKEAAKSSVEQTSIEFLNYCLNPHLITWEQELKRKVFVSRSAAYFAKFDVQRLLYPDAESRAKFYTSGKNGGWLNSNDIRELEDMNPIEDGSGDVYWMPVNMQDAAHPATAPHLSGGEFPGLEKPIKPEKPLGGAPQNRELLLRLERTVLPLFRDAYRRAWHRLDETHSISADAVRRCFNPALIVLVSQLADDHVANKLDEPDMLALVEEQIEPIREGMLAQGSEPEVREGHIVRQTRRVVEAVVQAANRYSPSQPRHEDGTFHDGSTNFYLGRHSTTDDDVNGVWSGQRNVKLNAQGIEQAKATAAKLKGLGIKRIVASPLARAQQTGAIYADTLGVPMTTDWRLKAIALGDLEGMNEKENANRLQLYVDNPDEKIPGGNESINEYKTRVNDAIDDLRSENEMTGPILALSHSSALANYISKVRGNKDDLEHSRELLSPAGVVQLNGHKVQTVAGELKKGDAA